MHGWRSKRIGLLAALMLAPLAAGLGGCPGECRDQEQRARAR